MSNYSLGMFCRFIEAFRFRIGIYTIDSAKILDSSYRSQGICKYGWHDVVRRWRERNPIPHGHGSATDDRAREEEFQTKSKDDLRNQSSNDPRVTQRTKQ
ncbi:hypothetical protein M758_UG215700 [Ceratodon purpureus]|nr:hypothetical protein M758_UG215700 [Ceratodon purpureus]